MDTVASMKENVGKSGVKVPSNFSAGGTGNDDECFNVMIPVHDVPGHFNFRAKTKDELVPRAKQIILMLDSADKDSCQEAAYQLYDLLSDTDIATGAVPLLIACNKSDLPFARRAVQVERDLAIAVETIRKVRKASREQELDNAQVVQLAKGNNNRQAQAACYLESLPGKFSFEQLKRPPKFVECSLKHNNTLEHIYKFVMQ